MRVISGEARGRRIEAPAGLEVRPTADRVRQTIFDLLAFRWQGGQVLDLFAGSGALGIEALSRGAERAVFGDRNPNSLQAVAKNLEHCGFLSRSSVKRGDFRLVVKDLVRESAKFALVLIDPPYEGSARDEAIQLIEPLLEPGAWVVIETASTEKPPEPPVSWRLETTRKFGRTLVLLYHYGENRDLSRQL